MRKLRRKRAGDRNIERRRKSIEYSRKMCEKRRSRERRD